MDEAQNTYNEYIDKLLEENKHLKFKKKTFSSINKSLKNKLNLLRNTMKDINNNLSKFSADCESESLFLLEICEQLLVAVKSERDKVLSLAEVYKHYLVSVEVKSKERIAKQVAKRYIMYKQQEQLLEQYTAHLRQANTSIK